MQGIFFENLQEGKILDPKGKTINFVQIGRNILVKTLENKHPCYTIDFQSVTQLKASNTFYI